ncbi:MAG: hypothetical protein JNK48_33970 [Bryobacterales bacterium]|nr:hypothetical protein [Bryobacterales bacterium]
MWALSILGTIAVWFWCAISIDEMDKKYANAASRPMKVTVEPRSDGFYTNLVIAVTLASFVQFCIFTMGLTWYARWPLVILLTFLAAFYGLFIGFRSVRMTEPETNWDLSVGTGSALENVAQDAPDLVAVDVNDQVILRLESEIQSQVRRVDGFTLEGALIGALAFGAFVTIVASDAVALESLRHVHDDLLRIGVCSLSLDVQCGSTAGNDLVQKDRLLSLVSILALFSSVFFLSVIVARIRFTALLAPAEYFVKLSSSLNGKEEHFKDLLAGGTAAEQTVKARLAELGQDIDASLHHARTALALISPVVTYMAVFRNLGVLAFMAALIVSALWISIHLALMFLLICSVAYFYPQLDEMTRKATKRNHYFSKLAEVMHHIAPRRASPRN